MHANLLETYTIETTELRAKVYLTIITILGSCYSELLCIEQTVEWLPTLSSLFTCTKVLQCVRTGVQVNCEDVLAVVLSEVAPQLTSAIPKIVQAAVKGGLGCSNVSKDFLIPTAVTTFLTRGPNTTRRNALCSFCPSFQTAPETAFWKVSVFSFTIT